VTKQSHVKYGQPYQRAGERPRAANHPGVHAQSEARMNTRTIALIALVIAVVVLILLLM
jgi:hypothetical protein